MRIPPIRSLMLALLLLNVPAPAGADAAPLPVYDAALVPVGETFHQGTPTAEGCAAGFALRQAPPAAGAQDLVVVADEACAFRLESVAFDPAPTTMIGPLPNAGQCDERAGRIWGQTSTRSALETITSATASFEFRATCAGATPTGHSSSCAGPPYGTLWFGTTWAIGCDVRGPSRATLGAFLSADGTYACADCGLAYRHALGVTSNVGAAGAPVCEHRFLGDFPGALLARCEVSMEPPQPRRPNLPVEILPPDATELIDLW